MPTFRFRLLISLLALPMLLRAVPSSNTELRAVPAPGRVTIDGRLDDWDTRAEVLLCDDVTTPAHAVRVAAMYDADGLYVAFRFFDLSPMVNHVDPVSEPGQGWCGDAVQLRFWCEPEKPLGPPDGGRLLHLDSYWYTDGKRATAHAVWGSFQPGQTVEKSLDEALGHGVECAFVPQTDGRGYTQEMRVAWAMLRRDGRPYHADEALRLGIEAFWGDKESHQMPALRVVDLYHPDHPQRDYYWMNHAAWGTLTFVGPGPLAPSASAADLQRVEEALSHLTVEFPTAPVVEVTPPNIPYRGDEKAGALVNGWFAAGTAAGNANDWYDNRDRTHSMLDLHAFPQLKLQMYAEDARRAGADWATAWTVLPHPTVGNSSTSGPPETDGSNPRSMYLSPAGLAALYAQYRGNNLYIYPGHLDYRPGHNGRVGHGDLLPVNTPYLLVSRGSSGSDQPFLRAAVLTMAAFSPEVKSLLRTRGLLMPTLQALMRGAYGGADYFTGAANPSVFDGTRLDMVRMVTQAHAMTPATIPPLVQLRVLAEPAPTAPRGNERLGDTPCVIARVHRRLDRDYRLTVSARESVDVQGRPLTFRWVVLQGDAKRIRIRTRDHGATAELTIPYHGRFPIAPGSPIESNRVDIGVFACGGGAWSAPGFVTVCYPDNELRTYDARGRLIDLYDAAGDTTIGYDTTLLLATGDKPVYDITDWPAAFAAVEAPGLPGDLLRAHLTAADRAQLARARTTFAAAQADYPAAKTRILGDTRRSYLDQTIALDALTTATSAPLLTHDPATHRSAKAVLERALNAVKDDVALFPAHGNAINTSASEEIGREANRLTALGLLQQHPGHPAAWHAIRAGRGPVVARLTNYERYEIASFNLLLMNRVLYPTFLHVPTRPNLYDRRLTTSQGAWTRGK